MSKPARIAYDQFSIRDGYIMIPAALRITPEEFDEIKGMFELAIRRMERHLDRGQPPLGWQP